MIANGEKVKLNTKAYFDAPGFLYFISAGARCEACKSVKIGVVVRDRLLGRLRAIQSANHTKIRLLGVVEYGSMREAEIKERELHRQFMGIAHIPHGHAGYEWFSASSDLVGEIQRLVTKPLHEIQVKEIDTVIKLFWDA